MYDGQKKILAISGSSAEREPSLHFHFFAAHKKMDYIHRLENEVLDTRKCQRLKTGVLVPVLHLVALFEAYKPALAFFAKKIIRLLPIYVL